MCLKCVRLGRKNEIHCVQLYYSRIQFYVFRFRFVFMLLYSLCSIFFFFVRCPFLFHFLFNFSVFYLNENKTVEKSTHYSYFPSYERIVYIHTHKYTHKQNQSYIVRPLAKYNHPFLFDLFPLEILEMLWKRSDYDQDRNIIFLFQIEIRGTCSEINGIGTKISYN